MKEVQGKARSAVDNKISEALTIPSIDHGVRDSQSCGTRWSGCCCFMLLSAQPSSIRRRNLQEQKSEVLPSVPLFGLTKVFLFNVT
jgi:hypothetical protein